MSSPIKAWREQKKIPLLLGRKGKIVTLTKVRVPPSGFVSDAPYYLAIVEIVNKQRLIGQITDAVGEHPQTGDEVEVVYRRQKKPDLEGVIYYGLKFKLIKTGK